MQFHNEMTINFKSKSENEKFARTVVAAFIAELDPTIDELSDVKTAVSEAVTNAIIHGYNREDGVVTLQCGLIDRIVYIKVIDKGCGIDDIEKAQEPLYTSKPQEERSGLGFTVMESFMDEFSVTSKFGEGTVIEMSKKLSSLN